MECSAHRLAVEHCPGKILSWGSADGCDLARRNEESSVLVVEVSSRTIIQFPEMFMDLGGQREADLKYICGFVKRG